MTDQQREEEEFEEELEAERRRLDIVNRAERRVSRVILVIIGLALVLAIAGIVIELQGM
ncbi:MAG: hypothetical protein HFG75_05650 [Hungatella sp.]|nr:hypothetical protein [Hungatella sp.]